MGEIIRFVFRSFLFLGVTLSIESARADSIGSKLCEGLFQKNTVSMTVTLSTSTGLIAIGAPYRVETEAKAVETANQNPRKTESPYNESNSAAVYNDTVIQELLSTGAYNKKLRPLYEDLISRGQYRFLTMPPKASVLDPLYETMPNFRQALDEVRKSVALAHAAQTAFRMPKLILLGDPGLGKTRFGKAVAKAVGAEFEVIAANSVSAGWVLSGAHATYEGSQLGRVAKILIEKKTANPIVVVDELDKARESEGQSAATSLHQLWEKQTAREFQDEFAAINFDASNMNWIATANDIDGIPKPIRSRALIIEIPRPTKEEMRTIIPSILKELLAEEYPKLQFSTTIKEDVFQLLYMRSPREVAQLLDSALGNAALANRRHFEPSDIDLRILNEPGKKRGIGFLAEF